MATWQKPKTDWTGVDGVLYSDMNRIEDNAQYLMDSKATKASTTETYYVAPSGSDSNDGKTAAAPFATIQKALDVIPKLLNGSTATINLVSGTYTGFTMSDFSGGVINIMTGNADIDISSAVSIANCHAVRITGTGSLIVRSTLSITNTPSFACNLSTTVSRNGGNAVEVLHSRAIFTDSLTVTSSTSYNGVLVDQSSLFFVESLLSMPGTGTGIMAERGSVAAYTSYNNRASVGVGTARGGRVYTGSQGLD